MLCQRMFRIVIIRSVGIISYYSFVSICLTVIHHDNKSLVYATKRHEVYEDIDEYAGN